MNEQLANALKQDENNYKVKAALILRHELLDDIVQAELGLPDSQTLEKLHARLIQINKLLEIYLAAFPGAQQEDLVAKLGEQLIQ